MTDNTSLPKIEYAELLQKLNDDAVSTDEIAPYFLAVPGSDGRIDPIFQPNPSLVTGLGEGFEGGFLVSIFNAKYRRERNNEFRRLIQEGWAGYKIVDEGDSWFQYPKLLDDIIDFMAEDHAVYSLSGAGHTLKQMLKQNEIAEAVAQHQPHALMLSAGGNDLFAGGNIANLIEDVVPGQQASSLVGKRFDDFLENIIQDMRGLLSRLLTEFPHLVILIHGYAAAYSRMDRWIGKPLRDKGVMPQAVQNAVIKIMLDRVNDAQISLTSETEFSGRVIHVDLRGLGKDPDDDWFDEIHMSDAQNKLAAERFDTALRAAVPAPTGGFEGGMAVAAPPRASLPRFSAVPAIAAHASQLMSLDEDMLEAELAHRIAMIEWDPSAADLPSSELLIMASGFESRFIPAAGAAAKRLIRRWEREFYDLLCGDSEEDRDERDKLRNALGVSNEILIGALTAWLISGPLGVPALLAGVLAAILVKRFGGAAADELCKIWSERLAADGT